MSKEKQVGHTQAAKDLLVEPGDGSVPSQSDILTAQVHASLAIAQQLERLNDRLDSVVGKSAKEPFGSKRFHVRTGR